MDRVGMGNGTIDSWMLLLSCCRKVHDDGGGGGWSEEEVCLAERAGVSQGEIK